MGTLVWGGLCVFFGVLAMVFYQAIRGRGRRLIRDPQNPSRSRYLQVEPVPLGSRFCVPTEPTSILGALNFTGDRGELFNSEPHRYSFENQGMAAKFAALNADRTWNPAAPRARLADKARWVLLFGMILLGLYLILKNLFR